MKPLVYLLSALMMISVAAGDDGNKEKDRQERAAKREAITKVLDAKDKNKDGSLTKDEYIAGEADAEAASKRFDQFNKNGDRALSKGEIADSVDQ